MKFHCKTLVALALAVTPAAAQPAMSTAPKTSQHARVGQLAEVMFQRGAITLPIGSERELGQIAAWAKQNPEGLVVVEGHADRAGPEALNLTISTRRAESVVAQLLVLGIDREQIVVASYGESRAGRRIIVWGTRSTYDTVEAQLRARGAKTVQTSNLMARR